jgi:hypothetical protein
MDEGKLVGMDVCYLHGQMFRFDPHTVVTVLVDPQTGWPPDVDENNQPCTPDSEAIKRAVKRPVCDACVERVNRTLASHGHPRIELAADKARRLG